MCEILVIAFDSDLATQVLHRDIKVSCRRVRTFNISLEAEQFVVKFRLFGTCTSHAVPRSGSSSQDETR
jgi:hypothetical protein